MPGNTSTSRTSTSTSNNGSLSSVVSSLMRAQYGLTSKEDTTSTTETDLDRHVAELLLQEAKERQERAKKDGKVDWTFSDDEG